MANGGLRSVREALLLAYGTNVIDSVEFVVFYDANSSRELFPYRIQDGCTTTTLSLGHTYERANMWS